MIYRTKSTNSKIIRNILICCVAISLIEVATLLLGPLPLISYIILLPVLLSYSNMVSNPVEQRIIAALSLVPLLRILTITIPFVNVPPLFWYALIGIPAIAAVWLVAWLLGLRRTDIGLGRWRWSQLLIAISGVPLGVLGFVLLPPHPTPHNTLFDLWAAVALLILFVGFTEELIFRGVIQRMLSQELGAGSILLSSLLSGGIYSASGAPGYALLAFCGGLLWGWCAYRTNLIWGAALAHAAMVVTLFVAMPVLRLTPAQINQLLPLSAFGTVIIVGLILLIFTLIVKKSEPAPFLAPPRPPLSKLEDVVVGPASTHVGAVPPLYDLFYTLPALSSSASKRYSQAGVLALVTLGLAEQQQSLRQIARWAGAIHPTLRKDLHLDRKRALSSSTMRRILHKLDPIELRTALQEWLEIYEATRLGTTLRVPTLPGNSANLDDTTPMSAFQVLDAFVDALCLALEQQPPAAKNAKEAHSPFTLRELVVKPQ